MRLISIVEACLGIGIRGLRVKDINEFEVLKYT